MIDVGRGQGRRDAKALTTNGQVPRWDLALMTMTTAGCEVGSGIVIASETATGTTHHLAVLEPNDLQVAGGGVGGKDVFLALPFLLRATSTSAREPVRLPSFRMTGV